MLSKIINACKVNANYNKINFQKQIFDGNNAIALKLFCSDFVHLMNLKYTILKSFYSNYVYSDQNSYQLKLGFWLKSTTNGLLVSALKDFNLEAQFWFSYLGEDLVIDVKCCITPAFSKQSSKCIKKWKNGPLSLTADFSATAFFLIYFIHWGSLGKCWLNCITFANCQMLVSSLHTFSYVNILTQF